jgi:hypothetical protein
MQLATNNRRSLISPIVVPLTSLFDLIVRNAAAKDIPVPDLKLLAAVYTDRWQQLMLIASQPLAKVQVKAFDASIWYANNKKKDAGHVWRGYLFGVARRSR